MTIFRTIKRRSPLAGFAMASIVLMWAGLSAQSAEQQIVADASTALGGRERILAVKTLIVEGGGRDLNVGQSLRFDDLGLQSDVWQIREYKRAYDLANTRARFEAIREAQYPFYQGEAAPRLIQGLDGEIAFNVNAEGSATRIFGAQATGRLAEYLRHPLTLVRAALQPTARLSNARTQGNERLVDVTVGGATLTLAIDATTKLPTRVIQMTDSATLGDTPVETRFAGYEAVSGLQLPTRLTTRTDRWLSADVRIMRQSVDGTLGDLAAPPNVRAATQPPAPAPPTTTSREIAKGVWFVEGTTHKSLLAEFSDHMLLIEAPNNERVRAVLAKARELRPNKPVTKLLVTHHHGDHTSGVRLAVAEGVTEIITHRSNVAYLNLVLTRPHTINPDELSKKANARLPKITPIDDEGVLRDSTDDHQPVPHPGQHPRGLDGDGVLPQREGADATRHLHAERQAQHHRRRALRSCALAAELHGEHHAQEIGCRMARADSRGLRSSQPVPRRTGVHDAVRTAEELH